MTDLRFIALSGALGLAACGGSVDNAAGSGGASSGGTGAVGNGGSAALGGSGGSGATGTGATGGTATGGSGGGITGPRCGDADFLQWKLEELPNAGFSQSGRTALSGSGPDVVHAVSGSGAWERAAGAWTFFGAELEPLAPFDVASVGAGDAWVALSGGMVAHHQGTWQMTQGLAANPSLYRAPDGTLFEVGDGGTIARFDGNLWQAEKAPTTNALRGIHGVSSSDAFAVGLGATVLHRDANGWQPVTIPAPIDFAAVWAVGPGDAFAVGVDSSSGALEPAVVRLGVDSAKVLPLTTNFGGPLADVWGSAPDDVFVVGGPSLFHWDGSSFTSLAELESTIEAVWGSAPNDVYIALNGGSQILHCQL